MGHNAGFFYGQQSYLDQRAEKRIAMNTFFKDALEFSMGFFVWGAGVVVAGSMVGTQLVMWVWG